MTKLKRTVPSLMSNFLANSKETIPKSIAVGGGGAGGAVAPPFGSKRRKRRQFGQIVWIFRHTIAKIPSQFWLRPFFFFFFFFFCRTPSFGQKNRSNFREDLFFFFFTFFFWRTPQFGQKNRLNFDRETQCIKSFFGQKFAAPPNHFELLRPCLEVLCGTNNMFIKQSNINCCRCYNSTTTWYESVHSVRPNKTFSLDKI